MGVPAGAARGRAAAQISTSSAARQGWQRQVWGTVAPGDAAQETLEDAQAVATCCRGRRKVPEGQAMPS